MTPFDFDTNSPPLPLPLAPALLPAQALPLLQPHMLGDAAIAAITRFQKEGESENTRRTYRQALRYWLGWFQVRYGQELKLPVHVATVAQFVVDHVETAPGAGDQQLPPAHDQRLVDAGVKAKAGALSLATIELRLAALARAHRDQHLPSPVEEAHVRRLLRNVRATQAKAGAAPNKKAALDKALLHRLLAVCEDTPLGRRDRALLAFGWATGGRRRSEIAGADFAFLTTTSDGFRYRVAHSKTNQTGVVRPQDIKPVIGQAAKALHAWLEVLDDQGVPHAGRIFRQVLRGGFVGDELSGHAVREIVKRRCDMAGLNPDEFSAHSLRSGFLTEAGRRGVSLKAAMNLSGHSSVVTALGYMREGEVGTEPVARLLDEGPL